jgi:hypothetical protein
MKRRFSNRLLTTSLALASAGTLTCIGAMLDVLMPAISTLQFLAWLCLAGVAVLLVLLGFSWACNKADEAFSAREEWRVNHQLSKVRLVTSARGGQSVGNLDPPPNADLPVSRRLLDYPVMLRGVIRSASLRTTHAWHGQ